MFVEINIHSKLLEQWSVTSPFDDGGEFVEVGANLQRGETSGYCNINVLFKLVPQNGSSMWPESVLRSSEGEWCLESYD